MDYLLATYLFLLGACFGSFAGAVAWRLYVGRNFTKERSECEHCHHVLSPLDLIPVASWLWLRGRCRYCKKPIGSSALLSELTLGSVFVLSYLYWPFALTDGLGWAMFVVWLAATVCLTTLFLYDMKHYLLPDKIVFPLIALGVVLFVYRLSFQGMSVAQAPLELLLALLPVAGLYALLYAVSSGKWVGFGDVKLGIFIGLALGWQGALAALIIANLLGTLWVVPQLATKRLSRTDVVPFGPFLIVATVMAFLWADELLAGYLALFLV